MLLNRDADQNPRQVASAGKTMERLTSHVVQRHLMLEIGAMGGVSDHGFHASKAQVPGQLLVVTLPASRDALHCHVNLRCL